MDINIKEQIVAFRLLLRDLNKSSIPVHCTFTGSNIVFDVTERINPLALANDETFRVWCAKAKETLYFFPLLIQELVYDNFLVALMLTLCDSYKVEQQTNEFMTKPFPVAYVQTKEVKHVIADCAFKQVSHAEYFNLRSQADVIAVNTRFVKRAFGLLKYSRQIKMNPD